jgi:hypothetical protein
LCKSKFNWLEVTFTQLEFQILFKVKEVEYAGHGSWANVWGEALDKLVEVAVQRVAGVRFQPKEKRR